MQFEWDEIKNTANIAKHGLSFDLASEIFVFKHITEADKRYDYGEIRHITIGTLELSGRLYVVTHTNRNGRLRIISFRKANTREHRKFRRALEQEYEYNF